MCNPNYQKSGPGRAAPEPAAEPAEPAEAPEPAPAPAPGPPRPAPALARRYWLARRDAEDGAPASVASPGRGLCVARATRAFDATGAPELPLAAGARVLVVRDELEGAGEAWVFAAAPEGGGASGYVPRAYLVAA